MPKQSPGLLRDWRWWGLCIVLCLGLIGCATVGLTAADYGRENVRIRTDQVPDAQRWKRATTQGAVFAIVLGLLTWGLFLATPAGQEFPAQLAGVLASLAGMVLGSLGPQAIRNANGSHHKLVGAA